jgi:hypothetical protein
MLDPARHDPGCHRCDRTRRCGDREKNGQIREQVPGDFCFVKTCVAKPTASQLQFPMMNVERTVEAGLAFPCSSQYSPETATAMPSSKSWNVQKSRPSGDESFGRGHQLLGINVYFSASHQLPRAPYLEIGWCDSVRKVLPAGSQVVGREVNRLSCLVRKVHGNGVLRSCQ